MHENTEIASSSHLESQGEGVNRTMTHWQKITSNNHALTKLFSQLPAGTKNLVSNAIQAHNKIQNESNHKGKRETFHRPYMADTKNVSPDPKKPQYANSSSKPDIGQWDPSLRPSKSLTAKKQKLPMT
jgi:hypothetical protein